MGSIRDVCHRAIWLKDGRVHAQGPAREVAEKYETEMRRTTLELTPDDEVAELPGGVRLETKKNRFGSGEVRITGARLDPGPVMTSGGPFAVEIDFDAREPVVSPVFVVSVKQVSGPVCVDLNTQTSKAAVPELSGPGTIRLVLDRLDLARGDYRVSVGVFPPDWAHAYDFHWASYPLKVQGPPGGEGVLAPRASWVFSESDHGEQNT
jgi:lipopolysaccharide transport system ATP-binding protein